ncbi:peptidase U32 family protein, partial [Eggerthella lenta]|uniref:peptidase U32 family protein n=1 Tax=Eggerthella lenta TaxID=84112 RepID=UPI0021087886
AGIEAAARRGAQRVTLARELAGLEIAHLAEVADGYGREVESFAHGALGVCYSGQCFMSSLSGGRSANRGLC